MFDVNDKVLLKDEDIVATVIGYSEDYKDLVFIAPVMCDKPNYTWSSFEDNLVAIQN